MNDVSVLFVDISASVKTLDVVSALAESLKNVVANACHNKHVKYNVDRVCKLDTVLCEGGAYYTHGVGNNVHCASLHRALVKLGELFLALCGIHPVVDVTCVFLLGSTDKGSPCNTCNVVNSGAVEVATGKLFLIQLDDLAGSTSLSSESICLLFAAVDPNDLVGLSHSGHIVDPIKNILVVGRCHVFSPLYSVIFIANFVEPKDTLCSPLYIVLYFLQDCKNYF